MNEVMRSPAASSEFEDHGSEIERDEEAGRNEARPLAGDRRLTSDPGEGRPEARGIEGERERRVPDLGVDHLPRLDFLEAGAETGLEFTGPSNT